MFPRKYQWWMFLAAALAAFTTYAGDFDASVVYGEDNRLDLYQVDNSMLLKLADSTVALIDNYKIQVDPATHLARISTVSYADSYDLCPSEPFYNQQTAAFCSGSLVGEDLILTAGHCIPAQEECEGTSFVFGFAVKAADEYPQSVAEAEVYHCSKLLGREQVDNGADWALIRLDRKVTHHEPLALNRSGLISNRTQLVVIGHPAGLPTKVSGGAWVRNASPDGYFIANLDTYGGNSGSAVFNANTGLVEGVLVRGEQDYSYNSANQCYLSNVCNNDACRGEDVTKISAVLSQLP